MDERIDSVLKFACLALGAGLLVQVVRVLLPGGPLDGIGTGGPDAPQPGGTAAAAHAVSNGVPGGTELSISTTVQARIDRITASEILGQVRKPPPMALIGIAGHDVVLRAPNGQEGMLRVGDELGGVKLLQIGTNRALVELGGEKKELTLFSGLGSETLLTDPQQEEPPK